MLRTMSKIKQNSKNEKVETVCVHMMHCGISASGL